MIHNSLTTLHILGQMILDVAIADESLRQTLFNKVDKEKLTAQMDDEQTWLTGKYSHVFNLVVERFPCIRQYAPTLIERLDFRLEEGTQSTIIEAVNLLQQINEDNKRKLPDDAPLGFTPTKAEDVPEHLTQHLARAYDKFLESLPKNSYASVGENGWHLSVDPSDKLDEAGKKRLKELKAWLA